MAAPIFFDPCPVPAKTYAERMGVSEETLVLMHLRGDFKALEKIGKKWFVLPARVIQLSLDNGDTQEGRAVSGGLPRPDGEDSDGLRVHERGGGKQKADRAPRDKGGWVNPLG